MRRFSSRSRRTRAPRDLVWAPTVTACLGSLVAGGCNGTPLGIALVDNGDWQQGAASNFDRAVLLRLHLSLSYAFPSESSENAVIWGVFKLSHTTILPNLFTPTTWSSFDVLTGPHFFNLQSLAPNPLELGADIKSKRRLTSDDNIVFAIQGSDADNQMQIWLAARALVNRLVK